MIENMRKYTGLMAIVFVLLGAGFLFTMGPSSSGGGGGSGPAAIKIYGNSYDQVAYQRMGETTLQLANEVGLNSYINFLMAPDAQALQQAIQLGRYGMNYFSISQRNLTHQDLNRFIVNRVTLQKAMIDMGVHAEDEEVTKALKTSPTFSTKDGKFDQAAYALFIEKRLGRLGMTEKDLRAIISESLCLNKIVSIVGGGIIPSRATTEDLLEAQTQTVTLAKITLNRDDFVEKEKPTEEEIKAYWEAHQDAYKTDEQRSISYILINLPKEADKKKDTAEKTATTDEEKAAQKAKKDAEQKAKAEKAEKRRVAAKGLTKEITDTYQDILDSESAKLPLDIKAIAAARKQAIVKTELFTRATLPKGLADLNLRGSSNRNRPLGDDIFSQLNAENDYDRVSDPLPVGEHGWIIFVVEKVVTPELLDFTAARNKARANLIGENATKKVKQAAKDQRTAILALMKTGKSFDAAAKEKGLTPVQVGPFTLSTAPKDEPAAAYLQKVASGLNPGDVSETIDTDTDFGSDQETGRYKTQFNDRAVFFFLDKREIEDTEQNKLSIDHAVQGSKLEFMLRTYLNWLNFQYAEANVSGRVTEQD